MAQHILRRATAMFFALIALQLMCGPPLARAAKIYVKVGGSGGGASWADAYGAVGSAINSANPGDEILIQGGTYTQGTLSLLVDDVTMTGAYTGVDDVTRDLNNKTVLERNYSGRVMDNIGSDPRAKNWTFDGIVFTEGSASSNGGGLNLSLYSTTDGNNGYFIFRNCEFRANRQIRSATSGSGGAAFATNRGGYLEFDNCVFADNTNRNNNTGAIYAAAVLASVMDDGVVFNECVFENNVSQRGPQYMGGAVYTNRSATTITRCQFLNNRMANEAGAPRVNNFKGGAAQIINCEGLLIEDCVFDGNGVDEPSSEYTVSTVYGGALFVDMYENMECLITSCSFTGSRVEFHEDGYDRVFGGAIYLEDGNHTLLDCVIEDNITTVVGDGSGWNSQGGGLYVHDNAESLTMRRCRVNENQILHIGGDEEKNPYGAGAYIGGGTDASALQNLEITDCQFNGNRLYTDSAYSSSYYDMYGGGMYIQTVLASANGVIRNCEFNNNELYNDAGYNRSANWGGGLCVSGTTALDVINCRFDGNRGLGKPHYHRGMGIDIHGGNADITFTSCTINGNDGSHGAGVMVYTGNENGAVNFVNSQFCGNWSKNAGTAIFSYGRPPINLVNCVFEGNRSSVYSQQGTGLYGAGSTTGGPHHIINTIFANNTPSIVLSETGVNADIVPTNCLFHNNSYGFNDEGAATHTNYFVGSLETAQEMNDQIDGGGVASGNLDGNPIFRPEIAGTWTEAPTEGSAPDRSLFTDANASFTPGALVGRVIDLDPDLSIDVYHITYGVITANTATTIETYGYMADLVGNGDGYAIKDYHTMYGSAAIDQGVTVTSNTLDADGNPFGADVFGIAPNGAPTDIGPYEFTGPVVALAPLSMDFGTTIVGLGPTPARQATLENLGTEDLVFGLAKSGAGAGEFDETFPATTDMAPGAPARVIEVAFDPTSSDTFTAAVDLTSNDPDWPTTSIALTGVGEDNLAPLFAQATYEMADALTLVDYDGRGSLAGTATDDNTSDVLNYTKNTATYSGPGTDWLAVASVGDLSGTPQPDNAGDNTWTVTAHDLVGATDTATLQILVINAPPGSTVSGWTRY